MGGAGAQQQHKTNSAVKTESSKCVGFTVKHSIIYYDRYN